VFWPENFNRRFEAFGVDSKEAICIFGKRVKRGVCGVILVAIGIIGVVATGEFRRKDIGATSF